MRKVQAFIAKSGVEFQKVEHEVEFSKVALEAFEKAKEDKVKGRVLVSYKNNTEFKSMSDDYIRAHVIEHVYKHYSNKVSDAIVNKLCAAVELKLREVRRMREGKSICDWAEMDKLIGQLKEYLLLHNTNNTPFTCYLASGTITDKGEFYDFKAFDKFEKVEGKEVNEYKKSYVAELPPNLIVYDNKEIEKQQYLLKLRESEAEFSEAINGYSTFYEECAKAGELPSGKGLNFHTKTGRMLLESEAQVKAAYCEQNPQYKEFLLKYEEIKRINAEKRKTANE